MVVGMAPKWACVRAFVGGLRPQDHNREIAGSALHGWRCSAALSRRLSPGLCRGAAVHNSVNPLSCIFVLSKSSNRESVILSERLGLQRYHLNKKCVFFHPLLIICPCPFSIYVWLFLSSNLQFKLFQSKVQALLSWTWWWFFLHPFGWWMWVHLHPLLGGGWWLFLILGGGRGGCFCIAWLWCWLLLLPLP